MDHLKTIKGAIGLAMTNTVALSMLKHFAGRKRDRKIETVRRLLQVCGGTTKRSDVVKVFRSMEKAGWGRLIKGSHGHESRFEWVGGN